MALVRDGALVTVHQAHPLDAGEWLRADEWQLRALEPLGQVAPLALRAPAAPFDARRALDVPASPELARFLAQMRGELAPEAPGHSWRERLRALLESRGAANRDGQIARAAESGGVKIGGALPFLRRLGDLFQFRFGAGGRAPVLGAGERFGSELTFLFRPLGWLLGVAAIWNLWFGPRGDLGWSWPLILLMVALAWGLLVVARLLPTPDWMAHRVAQSAARAVPAAGGGSWDLMALLLGCGLAIGAWRSGNLLGALMLLALAFGVALVAHWARRRLDLGGGSGGNGAGGGANAGGMAGGGLSWLRRLFSAGKSKSGGGAAAKAPKNRANPLNDLLWRTQLSRLFGARQARYMMAMMRMFERGDLDSALRHAVPFNLFGEGAISPSLGTPRPRADLDFLGARGGGGIGVPLPPEIRARLTAYYRAAFDQLAAQHRVDEAAFVLAELLDSPLEAVEWLERHRQWQKAAALAEARDLDAGLTVRLWWLAGNRPRAALVAQRRNAFADGVSRLEREGESEREAAQTLRLLWAQNLAMAGDYAGAVEAAWPVAARLPAVRGVVGSWIERGLEGHGVGAARMLARQAHLLPDLSEQARECWRERVVLLLADGDEESIPLRLAFAALLGQAPPHDAARAAARRTVRALARDGARFPNWNGALQTRTKALLDFAADGPLRVDAAAHPFPAPPPNFAARSDVLDLRIEADDVGALALTDAAYLPDGSILVALGESGARLLNRAGRVVATFDPPCHFLAMAKSGERAIGVALRGLEMRSHLANDSKTKAGLIEAMGVREVSRRAEVARLCRFDLTRKVAAFWGEAEIGRFASHFEGGQWLLTSGDSVVSLDVTAPAPVALWKTPDAGFAACLASDESSLALLCHFYERNRRVRAEVWRFDLPSLALRERRLVPKPMLERLDAAPACFIDARGVALFAEPDAGPLSGVIKDHDWPSLHVQMPDSQGETVFQLEKGASWLAVLSRGIEGVVLRLWHRDERNSILRGQIELRDARGARFRLTDATLTLCDDRGRLLVLDLNSGQLLRDLRLF